MQYALQVHGHKEVEVLLKDSRVYPSCAIRYASSNGHKEIVEILLQDNRVDSQEKKRRKIGD
jgi:hypothetical protein